MHNEKEDGSLEFHESDPDCTGSGDGGEHRGPGPGLQGEDIEFGTLMTESAVWIRGIVHS